jgi:hypothetical protein
MARRNAAVFECGTPCPLLASGRLTDAEIRDGLLLAAATLGDFAADPDRCGRSLGRHQTAPAVDAGGHGHGDQRIGLHRVRALGPKTGLALAGLFCGIVSSTATIVGDRHYVLELSPGILLGAIAGWAGLLA